MVAKLSPQSVPQAEKGPVWPPPWQRTEACGLKLCSSHRRRSDGITRPPLSFRDRRWCLSSNEEDTAALVLNTSKKGVHRLCGTKTPVTHLPNTIFPLEHQTEWGDSCGRSTAETIVIGDGRSSAVAAEDISTAVRDTVSSWAGTLPR